MYVTWQNDKTYVKEIELPDQFIDTLRSAADLWKKGQKMFALASHTIHHLPKKALEKQITLH